MPEGNAQELNLGTGTAASSGDAAAAATAAAATAAAAAGTAAAGPGTAAQAQVAPADFPADWRAKIAPGDATLERFASPKAMYESYAALRARMSSGELKAVTPFPSAGTPEQQAEWRKSQGVPEAPDKYDLAGVEFTDADKPVIDDFLKFAHGENIPGDLAKKVIGWRKQLVESQKAQQAEAFAKATQETSDALNTEYGADYRRNMNAVANLFESYMPPNPDLKANVLKAVQSNPDFARAMVKIALDLNPTATLFPAGTGGDMSGLHNRIGEIEKMMKTNREAYNKDVAISGPNGEYMRLLRIRDQLKEKAA